MKPRLLYLFFAVLMFGRAWADEEPKIMIVYQNAFGQGEDVIRQIRNSLAQEFEQYLPENRIKRLDFVRTLTSFNRQRSNGTTLVRWADQKEVVCTIVITCSGPEKCDQYPLDVTVKVGRLENEQNEVVLNGKPRIVIEELSEDNVVNEFAENVYPVIRQVINGNYNSADPVINTERKRSIGFTTISNDCDMDTLLNNMKISQLIYNYLDQPSELLSTQARQFEKKYKFLEPDSTGRVTTDAEIDLKLYVDRIMTSCVDEATLFYISTNLAGSSDGAKTEPVPVSLDNQQVFFQKMASFFGFLNTYLDERGERP